MKLVEIVEGRTRLLVPEESLTSNQPIKKPVFFNPKAKVSRDMAVLAYRAYAKDRVKMVDALGGIGVRGIRAVNEVKSVEHAYINDANKDAIELAKMLAKINGVECSFSVEDANRFLLSIRDVRAEIIEIDPFGTPAYYVDNALRAIKDQGMICLTATDTPVLQGIYPRVAKRRYYGASLRTEYSNEIGLRLMLGMLAMVAGRLELAIEPLFVHSIRNHLRVYARVIVSNTLADEMINRLGFIYHCFRCGNRGLEEECKYCKKGMSRSGPLWISNIFDHDFVCSMLDSYDQTLDKSCKRVLEIALDELDTPTYYTLDDISARLRIAPPKLDSVIKLLRAHGFKASKTSLMPNGFRTDADYKEIIDIMV